MHPPRRPRRFDIAPARAAPGAPAATSTARCQNRAMEDDSKPLHRLPDGENRSRSDATGRHHLVSRGLDIMPAGRTKEREYWDNSPAKPPSLLATTASVAIAPVGFAAIVSSSSSRQTLGNPEPA